MRQGAEFRRRHVRSAATLSFASFVSLVWRKGSDGGRSRVCCRVLPVNDAAAEGPRRRLALFSSFSFLRSSVLEGRRELQH